jgi:capsular exopolysaccharide synthesis family protein
VDLREYVDLLRARWRLITACALLGLIAAAVASMLTTPQYKATTTLFVSASDSSLNVGTAYTGSLFTQQRVKSYVDVVTSSPVVAAVVDDLNLPMTPDEVASKLSVNNPLDTVLLEISATDANPEVAAQIANSTATQFGQVVRQIEQPLEGGAPLVKVTTIQAAEVPGAPYLPRTKLNLLAGLLLGAVVGIAVAVAQEALDTRVKTVEGLQKHFTSPVLAAIPYDAQVAKQARLTDSDRHSLRSEAYRHLRTNLAFVDIDHPPRALVVTSSVSREGKTTTAANLALAIAESGQPVILLEGDLRRPRVADYLGLEGSAGLTDVLVGRVDVDDVLQPWGTTGKLSVLPAGPLPPNASELLGSETMAELLHGLEERAMVVIDAPPLLPVTDGAVLTSLVGGAIIVCGAGRVRREQLRAASEAITGVGGRIFGLVLNSVPVRGPDAQRYVYGSGSSPLGDAAKDAPVPAVRPARASRAASRAKPKTTTKAPAANKAAAKTTTATRTRTAAKPAPKTPANTP